MCGIRFSRLTTGLARPTLLLLLGACFLGEPGMSHAQTVQPGQCTGNNTLRYWFLYTNGQVDSGISTSQEITADNLNCVTFEDGDTDLDAASLHLSCSTDYTADPTAAGNGLVVEDWAIYRFNTNGGVCGSSFPGRLIISKETVPGGAAQSFDFAIGALESFSLSDGQSEEFFLPAGSYLVTETVPGGWSLTGLVCSDPTADTTTNPGTATATVNLAQDETVSCTFTNTEQTAPEEATIIIAKETVPDASSQFFNFSGDLGNFALADGETKQFKVSPGTYAVSEMVPGGWELTGSGCDNGDNPGAITVADGDTVTCTFNNTELSADLSVSKLTNGNPGDGPGCDLIEVGSAVTWTYQVTNTGDQPLDIISILDDSGTPGSSGDDFTPGGPTGDDGNGILDPGETWTYTQGGATAIAGEYINTVTVEGEVVEFAEAKAEVGDVLTRSDTSRYCGTLVDLSIEKTDGDLLFVSQGGTLIYTLSYENLGTEDLTNVTISDTVPANTTFSAGASSAGWSCSDGDPAGTPCTINVGSVASGAGGQVFFGLAVDQIWVPDPETGECPEEPPPVTIDNTATVADDGANGQDVNPDNNTSSDDTPVALQCEDLPAGSLDINIEKTPDVQQLDAGDTASFTIEVTNTGEVDLINVTVTDPQSPDCDNVIGDLAAGASVSYACDRTNVLDGFTNIATVTGEGEEGGNITDDDDALVFVLDEPAQMHHLVPTMSQWAIILTAALMLMMGAIQVRKWTRR